MRLLSYLSVFLLTMVGVAHIEAQPYRLMSYNVRYDNPSDGENNWHRRKDLLIDQLRFHEPDVLGVQEALDHMIQYLADSLSAYDYVGVGREDGKTKGEFAAVFFRKETFELLDGGTFWLSETPGRPSKGWDASLERICTYAKLRDRQQGRTIWVFNTHFDHRGQQARAESGKVIVKKMQELVQPNEPIILTGDFNATPSSEPIVPILTFLEDARNCQDCTVYGQEGTFNGFDPTKTSDRRIDYIFTKNLTVGKYAVLSPLVDGRFLSDHHPIYVEAEIR